MSKHEEREREAMVKEDETSAPIITEPLTLCWAQIHLFNFIFSCVYIFHSQKLTLNVLTVCRLIQRQIIHVFNSCVIKLRQKKQANKNIPKLSERPADTKNEFSSWTSGSIEVLRVRGQLLKVSASTHTHVFTQNIHTEVYVQTSVRA